MRILYICYAFLIVVGATALNYNQADGNDPSGSGSGSRHGSGFFGSSHK